MSAEAAKSHNNCTEELVTNVFKELSSSGFLEQLRLECVANVKTMSTYLQLKKRFIELLNKKLSNAEWKFEVSAPRLSILREQIVECSVLAVTIERVVDEVVSWKLREQIVPIIKEILCAVYDQKTVGKLKLDGLSKLDGGNPSFSQLEEVIKKICKHIHVDWKHVFKDETIGKSLASISVSHNSDDEGSSSDESESDSDVEIISDEDSKRGKKRKIEITVDEEETRSKRERKKNSKYYSDIYDTPTIISAAEPGKTSPESTRLSSASDITPKKKETTNFLSNGIKKSSKADSNEKIFKRQSSIDKKHSKFSVFAVKSEPTKDKVPTSAASVSSIKHSPNKTIEEPKSEFKNGFVRKSERQPKPNSRFFWEPGESPQKVRVLAAEQEADQDLKQMELHIMKNELKRDITDAISLFQPETESSHHHNLSLKKHSLQKENQKEQDLKKKLVTSEASGQKYSVTELYKPRPIVNGKSKRGRPKKEDNA